MNHLAFSVAGMILGSLWLVPGSEATAADFAFYGDTNRDGSVTEADKSAAADWSAKSGAIFIANVDDDDNDGEVDAADNTVNGAADREDLAKLTARFTSAGSPRALQISTGDAGWVNVFVLTEDAAVPVNFSGGSADLSAIPAAAGETVTFGIEAKAFANPQWDGRVTLTLTGGENESASAALQVAPWIMQGNNLPAEVIYVREHVGRNEDFLADLREAEQASGADLFVIPGDAPYDAWNIWLQDMIELGYTQMPGVTMPVVLQANRNKSIDAWSKDELLGPDFGWVRWGSFRPAYGAGNGGSSWLDWYGNLEITPPLPGYPMGRMIYGSTGTASLNPEVVDTIAAQNVQGPPLAVDVSWLLIKHADETIAFVPTNNPADPYKAIVPDTQAFIDLLEQWVAAGHGNVPILSRYEDDLTVAGLLSNQPLKAHNQSLQTNHLDAHYQHVMNELGLDEDDLIRIPSYYNPDGTAMVPSIVNSAVANNVLMMPEPNGPVVEGKDQLEAVMLELLAALPQEKMFLNDEQYHKWSGNVHCGTNILREPYDQPWWEMAP